MTLRCFADPASMVATLRPERPTYCVRPHVLRETARHFVSSFPGRVLYAVKCNAENVFLDALVEGGVKHFDTASLAEIRQVRGRYPGAGAYFMHPVKSRGAIREAYQEHGIRHFVVDHPDELTKLEQETGGRDIVVIVRLSTARGAAVYDLGGKFGASTDVAAELLNRAHVAGHGVGLSFHVGSQCLDPGSYRAALRLSGDVLSQARVPLQLLDVGGGFPIAYVGAFPPPLEDYVAAITEEARALDLPADCELWAEPGRALVGAGASLVVRVELRRDYNLYLNDGIFGSLSDLNMPGIEFPMRVWRGDGRAVEGEAADFVLFGPTCDSADVMRGPFRLPADIREGDWIEIGQMGAYTTALRTQFNGFYPDQFVQVEDAAFLPTADMAPRRHSAAA